jgi:predicted nucleic acid-binding protein
MEKVFVDTDIALDLLSQREPHFAAAARLFTLADKRKLTIYISSLSFSNLNYLLTRQYDARESRRILNSFKVLVKVLPVDDKIIELALSSKFANFEDAIQYFAAIEQDIKILLTRNTKDYSLAKIAVLTPEAYLRRG